MTSPPKPLTIWAISGESVATQTCDTLFAAIATSHEYQISGLPEASAIIFAGKREESILAGIIAITWSDILAFSHRLITARVINEIN